MIGGKYGHMSRHPCETVRQWNERATAVYQECVAAVDAESKRLGLDCWQVRSGDHPLLDAAYEAALEDLDAADDERIAAAIALLLDDSVPRSGDYGGFAAAHVAARVV